MPLNFISSDDLGDDKVYMKYIELKHKDLFYNGDGNIFDKSLTLEENKIKDNRIVFINNNKNEY